VAAEMGCTASAKPAVSPVTICLRFTSGLDVTLMRTIVRL
jgi:hypothetical protein